MSDADRETRREASIARMREMMMNADLTVEQADQFIEMMRGTVHMLAIVMECNPDSPNYITFSYETPGDADYELTIRKHGGLTPGARIVQLEEEVARLRARIAEGSR